MARTLLAAAIAAPWVLWALVRVSGLALPYPVAPALAFTPYVALTAIVPVAGALLLRRRAVAGVALLAAVVLGACVVPRGVDLPGRVVGGSGPELTVMSVNVLQGRADAATVMRIAREHDVDVLALQESRPEWVARLDAARFPHRSTRSADEALLSAAPLRATGVPAEGDIVLGGGRVVRVRAVHPLPPISRSAWREWRDELAALPAADGAPAGVRRVLAGDFNATLDHPELRDLLGRGYRDAADVTGDGLRTTWPAGRRFPPEIAIDHVLADERLDVVSFSIRNVPGTDHRAVIARLAVP